MREVICKRCGRPNEVSDETLQLPKCPQCENIKFTKDFFTPIAEQVKENFIRAKETEYEKTLNDSISLVVIQKEISQSQLNNPDSLAGSFRDIRPNKSDGSYYNEDGGIDRYESTC